MEPASPFAGGSASALSSPPPVIESPRERRRRWMRALLPTVLLFAIAESIEIGFGVDVPFRLSAYTIVVVLAAFLGGLTCGLAAACVAWVDLVIDAKFISDVSIAEPSEEVRIFAAAVVLPSIALMAGLLKDRLRSATYTEATTRARNESAQQQLAVEETLRQTEAQLAHLFTNLPEPAWVFDIESLGIIAVNDAAVRLYGYSREEFLGLGLLDLRPPEEVPRLMEAISRNRDVPTLTGPWRHRTKDGSIRLVEVSSLPTVFAGRRARLAVIRDVTDRIRERDALLASERHFHSLADSAPALIWMCDRAGRTTYYNRAWLSFRGSSGEREMASDRIAAIHPDDAPRYRELFEEAISKQRPFSIEFRLRRSDDSYGWMLEQTLPRFGADGAFEGLTGSCTDITELHRAGELLRGSEGAMRALLRAMPDPIFRIKRDGTYVGFSARPEVRLILPPEQFMGKRAPDVLPSDIAASTMNAIERTLSTGEPTTFQYTRQRDDGLRSFEVRVVTCRLDEVIAIVRDVTDLRRAEDALRESGERLRVQFSRMPLGCILLDGERRVLEWNPAAERIFGWTASEIVGRDVVSTIVPDSARAQVEQIMDRLRAGDMSAHSTNANLTKDGRTITCEWFNTPLRIAEGQPPGILSMVRDVTEQLRTEEELRQAQKMDAIGQLASGVAHDFNNLLTAIFGHTNLARRTLSPGHPANTSLDRVEEAARQAGGVTRALLTFSREGSGEKRPFALGRSVRDAVRLLRRTLPTNIVLHASYDADGPPYVHGDPTQIQQVVLNLAINARDAMASGGSLKIVVSGGEPARYGEALQARLQVIDTGIGMAPAVQRRIFEPFFTTKPSGQGTGLGLSIVHGIIQDHGGRIEVRSEPGRGTTFTIILPAVDRPKAAADDGELLGPPQGNGELVLVGEDHTYIREIIASMLTSLGYRVVQAGDVETLHSEYERLRDRLHLVLIDADMPGCPGAQCVIDARAKGGMTPAIIMSGAPQNVDGIFRTQVLQKPFQMHELATAVARSLTYGEAREPGNTNGEADDGRQADLGAAGG